MEQPQIVKIEKIGEPQQSMHPKRFSLWLFMVSIVMIFAALTSAYIVRQAEGDWYVFELPDIFYYSSIVILLSSATMQWAYFSAKRDNLDMVKTAMLVTGLLGVAFLVMQYIGWVHLVDISVYFVGNPSGSFVYVLTGLHGLHLVSGVIFLLIMLRKSLQYKVHSKNLTWFGMCATYWHFLDGLWIYLFFFLLMNR